jgi:hypothetical protein
MRAAGRTGSVQAPETLGDVDAALCCARELCERGERERAGLMLFPECFLQGSLVFLPGSLVTEAHLRRHAVELAPAAFGAAVGSADGNRDGLAEIPAAAVRRPPGNPSVTG